jgi:hypothetical protein
VLEHVDAVQEDLPLARPVEPEQQPGDGALAAARLPHQRDGLATLDLEGDLLGGDHATSRTEGVPGDEHPPEGADLQQRDDSSGRWHGIHFGVARHPGHLSFFVEGSGQWELCSMTEQTNRRGRRMSSAGCRGDMKLTGPVP